MVVRLGHARPALCMTGCATARTDARVTEGSASKAGVILVAAVAGSGGGDMRRCFAERIPLCIRTVMTGSALARDDALRGRMSEGGSAEGAGVMAGIARQGRGDMIARLGHARTTLRMAAGASAWADTRVAKGGARETCVILMTGIAGGCRRYVVRGFAQGIPLRVGTVMASSALTGHYALRAGMRERGSGKAAARGMANIARKSGGQMV